MTLQGNGAPSPPHSTSTSSEGGGGGGGRGRKGGGGSRTLVSTKLHIRPSNEVKSEKGAGDTEINEVARK